MADSNTPTPQPEDQMAGMQVVDAVGSGDEEETTEAASRDTGDEFLDSVAQTVAAVQAPPQPSASSDPRPPTEEGPEDHPDRSGSEGEEEMDVGEGPRKPHLAYRADVQTKRKPLKVSYQPSKCSPLMTKRWEEVDRQ